MLVTGRVTPHRKHHTNENNKYFVVSSYSLLSVSYSQLSLGSLTSVYGNATQTSARFLCLRLFFQLSEKPWQHHGNRSPWLWVTQGLLQWVSQCLLCNLERVREHIPYFCMKNRMRARTTRRARAQTAKNTTTRSAQ